MTHDISIDEMNYAQRMHHAMCEMIAGVLADVADEGLPGDHHFFINFRTTHPQAELPDWLKALHPEEMTIVLQHQYDHLTVDDEAFSVTLSFNGRAAALRIPFAAILSFVDPSVEFGLRFEDVSFEEGFDDDDAEEDADQEGAPEATPAKPNEGGEVISFDKFRK